MNPNSEDTNYSMFKFMTLAKSAITYTSPIADWAKDQDYVEPEPLSAKDISTSIPPDSEQGSCLSHAEMKQIVHGLVYGKKPTDAQLNKMSGTQYSYLVGKNYELQSKGKFVAPTVEQLNSVLGPTEEQSFGAASDIIYKNPAQVYQQKLNAAKAHLEDTDTSLPEFWTATPLFLMGMPDFQPLLKQVNGLLDTDFRVKAVQYTRDASLWVYTIHILTIRNTEIKHNLSAELVGECGKSKQFLHNVMRDLKDMLDHNCVISHDEFAEIAQNKLMDQKKKAEHVQAQKKYEALLANPPQGANSYFYKGVMHVDPETLEQAIKGKSIADATLTAIATMFPNAATFKCKCPICGYDATVMNQVIHMNDIHDECTREYIADYLETLDVDLQIKENA